MNLVISIVVAVAVVTASVAQVAAQAGPRTPAPPSTTGAPATPGVRTLPGASPSASPATQPSRGATQSNLGATLPLSSEYVIGPGDVLQISVWKNETLSRVVPVRPDGKISMPLLHDIQASGLTAMQLRNKIAVALAEFLPNPEVSVSVNEVRSMRVSVLGEVQKPGVLELHGSTTILEAIAMAGGFRDFASPSKITVIRSDGNGKSERIRFNYNRAVSSGSEEHNLMLKPGDVVVVP